MLARSLAIAALLVGCVEPEPTTGSVEWTPLRAGEGVPGAGPFVSRGDVGIVHEHRLAYSDDDRWLDNFGGGAAALDCDGDGDLDLLFTGADDPDLLYLNDGTGRFTPGDPLPGGRAGPSASAAPADVDGDGDPDLLIGVQHAPNRLLINAGDCTFTDEAAARGLRGDGRSVHATWVDLDADGRLDLYVTDAADAAPETGAGAAARPQPDRLFVGGDGAFTDRTDALPQENAQALGMTTGFLDFDGDGDLDLFQSNDRGVLYRPNRLWRNDGDLQLVDVSAEAGFDITMNGMSLGFSDMDGDGDADVLLTGNYETILQREGPAFVDVGLTLGLEAYDSEVVSWSAALLDFDADGAEDIYLVRSNVYPNGFHNQQAYARAPILYRNRVASDAVFETVEPDPAAGAPELTRSLLAADLDGDGLLDAVHGNVDSAPTVRFGNPAQAGGRLLVELRGTASSPEGRGAVVRIGVGDAVQTRWPGAVQPFASGGPPMAAFGLGDADEVDWIEVAWPSGAVQRADAVPANQRVVITEP